jgi:hypothetical protein
MDFSFLNCYGFHLISSHLLITGSYQRCVISSYEWPQSIWRKVANILENSHDRLTNLEGAASSKRGGIVTAQPLGYGIDT